MKKKLMSFVFIIAAIYIGSSAILFFFQRGLMYHPSAANLDPVLFGLPEMAIVKVETSDGLSLTAWYRPPPSPEALTLVYFHGNAGHIGNRADKVKPYLEQGYGVLLLSFRGYGSNQGYPSEQNLYLDGHAALKFLADEGVPVVKTVIYGESLGSGIAVEVAQNKAVFSLVLEAPFSSMVEAAAHHFKFFPAGLIVRDKYDSLNKIKNIKAPILILHGQKDHTVPFKLGRKLFAAAPQLKDFYAFPRAGHNDLYNYGAAKRVIAYLEKIN